MKTKRITIICILIALVTQLVCCSFQRKQISKSGFYFDTIITITLYNTRDVSYIDHCFALAKECEDKFSNTIPDSEISLINQAAGKNPVIVSDDTRKLLESSLLYGDLSQGTFDITIGKLTDLWDFSELSKQTEQTNHTADSSQLPKTNEISDLLPDINYKNLEIVDNSIFLKNINSKIDIGAIAKGYIADKMKEYLNSQGITSGIINLGGNILTLGKKQDNTPYTIGIKRPFDEEENPIATVKVTDQSVVTSGIYERYFKVENKIYHHILDVKTGYPYENNLYSVTIISDSSMDGDALSTTCFALGLEKGMKLIENLDHTEAIFITEDYEIHKSSGIGSLVPFSEIHKN